MSPEVRHLSHFPPIGFLKAKLGWRDEVIPSIRHWQVGCQLIMAIVEAEMIPVYFVDRELHSREHLAIEAVIKRGRLIGPLRLRSVFTLFPVVNLPVLCQQMIFFCPTELSRFTIRCRAGAAAVQSDQKLTAVFDMLTLMTIKKAMQLRQGSIAFLVAVRHRVSAFLLEAGDSVQLRFKAIALLRKGILHALNHLRMFKLDIGCAPASEHCATCKWLPNEPADKLYYALRLVGEDWTGQHVCRIGSFYRNEFGRGLSLVTSCVLRDQQSRGTGSWILQLGRRVQVGLMALTKL
jgi:hypothetical protein